MSSDQVSRRDLFLGAGMTAGALAAIGAVGGIAYAPATQAALTKSRQYFATNVLLELDGLFAGRVLSAEGGEPVIVPATAVAGVEKTVATTSLRYEPLSLRLGDMSPGMYDWIGKATVGSVPLHVVNMVASNFDGKEVYRLAMENVRLTDVYLDSLDAARPEPARFTVKMAPGISRHQFGGKGTVTSVATQKATPIQQSNFRLYIQGVEAATSRARSIESVGIQVAPNGAVVPTMLRFAVSFADAELLFTWMQDTLLGKSGARQGELQLLSRDLSRVAASIKFASLMIVRVSCPVESSSTGTQFAEIECVPTGVTFNMGDLLK